MKKNIFLLILFIASSSFSQNVAIIEPGDNMETIIRKAANVRPSPRQFAWQEMEFTAFVHFTVNTFTDMEWGHGDEDPSIFNPTEFDAEQWARVCKDAGMKMIIVTAKHHDGFCLWPSKYTDHSVKSSPWQEGKGDILRDVSQACKKYGLKFGVYLSPWDRHEPTYGTDAYNDYFVNQLTELLTNYGPVHEVWFDGACGEGPNGKRQVYDFERYYKTIRELQPQAVIAIAGPDVRWVGTESGYGRKTEWSVVPATQHNLNLIAENSQQHVDLAPRGDLTDEDLGSRDKLANARALVWYPSEVDVSIRPGWFYHPSQDDLVKTPEKLLDIYYSSVGRNSLLLLNLPPDRRGLIHENDARNLLEMRRILDATFKTNLASGAGISASSSAEGCPVTNILYEDYHSYWTTDGVERAAIELHFPTARTFDRVLLQEYIKQGQRIESFTVDVWQENGWQKIAEGTTVGYKRLLRVPVVTTTKVRLNILASRTNPTISTIGLYNSPPTVAIKPGGGTFIESLEAELTTNKPGARIYYTINGEEPGPNSTLYEKPVKISQQTILKAVAIGSDGSRGLVSTASYNKAKYGIVLFSPYSSKYSAGGNLALIDGVFGGSSYSDGKWQGFEGSDLEAVIDLGERRTVETVAIGFAQNIKSWIFMPESVSVAVSGDGKNFENIANIVNDVPAQKEGELRKKFRANVGRKARYVKVHAKNRKECPEWHPGAGGKAWIFADEIVID